MLRIHFSNRIEALAGQLLARLAQRRGGVFDADTVIVPSAALRRWLTLEIARVRGVCAQVEFAYLGPWLWHRVGALLPGQAALAPVEPAVLAWRILAAFGDDAFTAAHPRLGGWLERADATMRWELARRVAAAFDHYATYRADWLAAWRSGRPIVLGAASPTADADLRWQAALWQRLGADAGAEPAALLDALAALQPTDAGTGAAPAAVQLFALPSMAPLQVELLRRLARLIDVDLYVLNPCREYWFEIVDPRRLRHLAARGRAQAHEVGNRLLAGWGKQTQALVDGLVEALGEGADDDAVFIPAGGATLLATLQDAILELRELEPGSVALDHDDRSIEVHLCHSRTRELEALHDHLLGLFAAGAVSHPSQVLVVTPDLEAAAPLIDAVFGTVPPERHIPYRISGRARSRSSAAARALLALLDLAGSRIKASAVAALLQQEVVARRFGLDAEALDQVHDWLRDGAICWGLDGAHRATFDLPASERHTWAQGLERLLLGYALPDEAALPFAGVAAAGGAEGGAARALGALAGFVDALAALHARTAAPLPAAAWPALLRDAIDDFIAADLDDDNELRDAIAALAQTWRRAGIDDALAIPLALARAALAEQLDSPPHGGVPGGGVTFTAMTSLRALPFEVVCAIGLDDGAFPSGQRPSEFDLIALAPRRGDRQRRDDERNLFLDLLLAARRSVYLSCVGRSQRDNAPLPPSVLIAELLDTLVPALAADPADAASLAAARARLVVEHPLQPFALAAFRRDAPARQRSHDLELAAALRAGLDAAAPAATAAQTVTATQAGDGADEGGEAGDDAADETLPPFFARPLAPPPPAWREVTLEQLSEFFRHPGRCLLRRRLEIDLGGAEDEPQDDEPFVAGGLARHALATRLFALLLDGADAAAVRALARAGGEFPEGLIGELQQDALLAPLHRLARTVRAHAASPGLPPHAVELAFDLDGEGWRLNAQFADLRPAGLLRWRAGRLRPTDRLDAWLAHLVLAAAPPPAWSGRTRLVALDDAIAIGAPPQPARSLLEELLRLYRRGLTEPLAFYPRAAWAYVERQGLIGEARRVWAPGHDRAPAEGDDDAWRLALRGRGDALGGDFAALAERVYGPLLAALDEDAR